VNGSRIDGRRPLKALDVIRIGAEEFRYYSATPERDRPAVPPLGAAVRLSDTLVGLPRSRPLAVLRIKSGDAKGARHQVTAPVVNLGRAESNEIRISDPSVSASHAKVQLREGVWTLTDLGSSNGSLVDDEPVTDETPLSPGATIKLGEVLISFEPNDERIDVVPRTVLTPRPASASPSVPLAAAAPIALLTVGPKRVRSSVNVGLLAVAIVVLLAALAALVLLV
jgi:pSer/pThr/pTyr-binding forkhead associated (FHA) protein